MFAKPYTLKSNNALKNSEKKHLAQRVQEEFPLATEEKVKEILPSKESCMCMKLVLHSGDIVSVYVVDGAPMLVEAAGALVPTVCALWKVPDLIPVLTIHSPVLAKIQNGAPLYLPGVSLPAAGAGFPMFRCGAVLGACTEDNGAACLVGRAAMSSGDMLLRASEIYLKQDIYYAALACEDASGSKDLKLGVCLDTLHVFGDMLCKDQKFIKIKRPTIALAKPTGIPSNLSTNLKQMSVQSKEEWPSLGPTPPAPAPHVAPLVDNQPAVIPADAPQPEPPCEDTDDTSPLEACEADGEVPESMDELLRWCLLSFIKREGRSAQLPLKTNLLYKNHMLPYCPAGVTLDVKKSSYKKLSKFLEAMQQEGLVETREVDKGVSAVVALASAGAHPAVRAHRAPPRAAPRALPAAAPAARDLDYTPPQIREVLCITAAVLDLFAPLKKGTALSPAEVRARLTEHVRAQGLSSDRVKGAVVLDATLAKIMNMPEQECVPWETVSRGVAARMTAGTELRAEDGTVRLARTRLAPVRMDVLVRSGNKKVTLVSNLESFGFSLPALAAACQRGSAASCGVTRAPGAAADQLMLQGDQTHYVAKLLIEKFELPKKFVEGADKALKKKK